MGTLRAIVVSMLFGLAGCPADDGGESTNTSEGTSSATTTGSGSSASSGSGMSASSTSSSSTDVGTSSGGEGSTTEVATGPVSTTGSSSSSGDDPTNGGDACDPDAQDHPCLECFVDDCCKSWTMCLADEGCTCIVDCHVIEGGSLGNCESQCDSDGELYQALFFCGQMYCLGTCEWDCC